MSSQSMSGIAFILSLIGGILMFAGGLLSTLWLMSGGLNVNGMMGGLEGMMNGYHNMMAGFGTALGFMSSLSFVGLVAGIVVIVGALMLDTRPAEHMTWAIVILVFSIVSLLGMGGLFIGALLGIAGGAVALSWKPTPKPLNQEVERR